MEEVVGGGAKKTFNSRGSKEKLATLERLT